MTTEAAKVSKPTERDLFGEVITDERRLLSWVRKFYENVFSPHDGRLGCVFGQLWFTGWKPTVLSIGGSYFGTLADEAAGFVGQWIIQPPETHQLLDTCYYVNVPEGGPGMYKRGQNFDIGAKRVFLSTDHSEAAGLKVQRLRDLLVYIYDDDNCPPWLEERKHSEHSRSGVLTLVDLLRIHVEGKVENQ